MLAPRKAHDLTGVMKRLILPVAFAALLSRAIAEPVAEPATWRELPAFRLTDGRSEAIVVPLLGGRVVHFGLTGGINWLWTGEPGTEKKMPALAWGGDKTYLGPHSLWSLAQEAMWPPPAPDFQPCEVVEPHGIFSTLSAAWPGSGARIRRDYSFGKDGELVIAHSVAPVSGSREMAALWVIAQTIPTDAVFVPLAAQSPYKDGYFRFGFEKPAGSWATLLSPTLLQLKPQPGVGFKLGAHPKLPALATVKDGLAFLQRADPQDGMYPEGAEGAGLSVEVYHHDLKGAGEYTELEQLSPLRRLDKGIALTTRWSIHAISETSPESKMRELVRLLSSADK